MDEEEWTDKCKGFDFRHTWARACLSLIELYRQNTKPVSLSVKQGLLGSSATVIGGPQSAVNHRPVYLRGLKTWFKSLGLLESL